MSYTGIHARHLCQVEVFKWSTTRKTEVSNRKLVPSLRGYPCIWPIDCTHWSQGLRTRLLKIPARHSILICYTMSIVVSCLLHFKFTSLDSVTYNTYIFESLKRKKSYHIIVLSTRVCRMIFHSKLCSLLFIKLMTLLKKEREKTYTINHHSLCLARESLTLNLEFDYAPTHKVIGKHVCNGFNWPNISDTEYINIIYVEITKICNY